ncbi:hypothetical protein [Enhygromyxa salina]|uniref:Peptidase M61 catalytic domain-containing protein n=1 Tax=Enhygromyxa salina TaxID=215803 RepID=A0A2S9YXG5_9BACT|nr:hypothetical protein [Enhygromyxa salina]PRQ09781.1 hypothetical protein ENSA7_05360 [Enhygromyxa salina]
MRSLSFARAFGLALCGVACRAPTAPSPATNTTSPTPTPSNAATVPVRVVLSPSPDGATAVFELSPSRDALSFAERGNVRRSAWTTSTTGVTLREEGLTADEPWSRAELRLGFDPQEYDRTYPAVTRAGSGAVIYTPALLVEGLDMELAAAPDTFVWPPLQAPYGYSYLGPRDEIRERGDIRLIGFDGLPAWLAQQIEHAVDASLPYYASELGRATSPPTVIASDQSPGPMGFHGDVTENAVIFLRFHGDAWQTSDPKAAQEVAKFVRHEAFHLWNRNHADDAPPWLHEGGAEYAALIAAVTAGVLTEDEGRQRLSRHVGRCRKHVGEQPMASVRSGSDVYDCGVVVQWLADLEARRPNGERSVLALWAEVLEGADARDGYSAASFLDRAGPLAQAFVTTTAGRWTSLEAALPKYGVGLSSTPTADDHRAAVLQHLMRVACGPGPIGYWTERDHIKLDTGEHCGALAGQPKVTKVGGHSLLESADRAFAKVEDACAHQRNIALTTIDGAKIRLSCPDPITLPSVLTLTRVPKLATGPASAPLSTP